MHSTSLHDVLITGLGIVSPIGFNRADVWGALESRSSGVRALPELAEAEWIAPFGGIVRNFDGKDHIQPRKSLKVMCLEMQFAMAAAELAWQDSGLQESDIEPQRAGIVAAAAGHQFCGLDELHASYAAWLEEQPDLDVDHMPAVVREKLYPLWMLKYLPNLNACHIGIRRGFCGPTNTIFMSDTSGLLAVAEAADVIRRGAANVMFAGGAATNLSIMRLVYHGGARLSRNGKHPQRACRPFDRDRSGMVYGEGAAFFILESRAHATRRGARPLARVAACGRRCEAAAFHHHASGQAIRRAIETALEIAEMSPGDIGHINAHGNSTREDDPIEARAIRDTLGDVPVTAPKSFIGNLNAASGAVELAVSLIALERGMVPPTMNYDTPDESCPVNVVTDPVPAASRTFMALNHAPSGQAVALVMTDP